MYAIRDYQSFREYKVKKRSLTLHFVKLYCNALLYVYLSDVYYRFISSVT